jgi:uncharacterized protein involved in exopolysaccharide biosynthesis
VQYDVINRLGLLKMFHTSSYEDASAHLAGESSFSQGGDGIITISVRESSAQSAAEIANAYLDALQQLNDRMAASQSDKTRRFFEYQLDQERAALATAETKLESTQQKTGLIQPETQTSIGLGAIASTRQRINELEVQLAALRQSATEQNPQVVQLRSEISQLEADEEQQERGGATPVGAAPAAANLPASNLDYVRAQREVQFHTGLVSSLSSQYETARLNEDIDRSAFQVIDRAIAPERKAWPPRKPYIAIALAFAFILGLFSVVARLVGRRILNDPAHREYLQNLRAALR